MHGLCVKDGHLFQCAKSSQWEDSLKCFLFSSQQGPNPLVAVILKSNHKTRLIDEVN